MNTIKESGRRSLEIANQNGFDTPCWSSKTMREQAEEIASELLDRGLIEPPGIANPKFEQVIETIEAGLKRRDTFAAKLLLTYAEITEAEQAVLGDHGDPLSEELADVAIRLTGILWGIWGDEWGERNPPPGPRNLFQPIETILRPIRDHMTNAVESWRKNDKVEARISLELAVKYTELAAQMCGVDLLNEMNRKGAKNALRPFRHGNQRGDA